MTNGTSTIARIEHDAGRTRLVGWQFAAEGAWDAAERFTFDRPVNEAADQVEQWLGQQSTGDIAFEALFGLPAGERFFFGVRLSSLDLKEKARVTQELMAACGKGDSLPEVIRHIRDKLGDPHLAEGNADRLELGVFDLWNKVKSLDVWKRGEKLGKNTEIISPEEMPGKTQVPDEGHAPLHQPQPNPLMMEAGWRQNRQSFQCWVSLPVSNIGEPSYTISKARYLSAATTFIGYNPG